MISPVINGHGHLLPEPKDIPAFMKEKGIFWIDDTKSHMLSSDWKRPITHSSFFIKEKLEWMESTGVDHMVVITLSQLYCNGMEESICHDVIRFQNDFHAQVQSENEKKITAGFVVQPAFVDQALKEIDRCIGLGLSVLCLPTHYCSADGQWKTVFNPETDPIFELANERNLAIQIHPYDAGKVVGLQNQYWRYHLIWMPAMTADAYHFFTLLDYPDRFPKCRVCFAHGNIMGQINFGRRKQGFHGRPDLFEGTVDPEKHLGHSNVFFDSLTHDVRSLVMILALQGKSQVILGLDDPYPLGEMDGIKDSFPGKVFEDAIFNSLLLPKEVFKCLGVNVARWLKGVAAEAWLDTLEIHKE